MVVKLDAQVTGGALVYEKKQLKKVMRAAANEVAAVAKALLGRSAGGGLVYYRAGRRVQASQAGSAPVSVTGALRRGIKVSVFRSGEGATIRDSQYYALVLEAGAKGGGRKGGKGVRNKRGGPGTSRVMQPRPFLSLALDQRADSIGARIREALVNDIEFRKVKP